MMMLLLFGPISSRGGSHGLAIKLAICNCSRLADSVLAGSGKRCFWMLTWTTRHLWRKAGAAADCM